MNEKLDHICIGSLVYGLYITNRLEKDTAGDASMETSEIRISDRLGNQERRHTLLHEVIHAVLEQSGQLKAAMDEGLVSALTYGLMDFLCRNPTALEFIMGETAVPLEVKVDYVQALVSEEMWETK